MDILEIREDYAVGDLIRIKGPFGVRDGVIVKFTEDNKLKIRPFLSGRKPFVVSGKDISSYEEADFPKGYEPIVKEDPLPVVETVEEAPATPKAEPEPEGPKIDPPQENDPDFVVGRIDLSRIDGTKTRIPEPSDLDESVIMMPVKGVVVRAGTEYGFITCKDDGTNVYFRSDQFIPQEGQYSLKKGDEVSFTLGYKPMGSVAYSILLLPISLDDTLALAEKLRDDGAKRDAENLLIQVRSAARSDNEIYEELLRRGIISGTR